MSEERFKRMLAVLIAIVTVIAAVLAQLQAEAGNRDDRANRDSKRASVEAFGLQIRGSTQANYHYFTAFEQYRELENLSEAAQKRHDGKAADRYGDMRDRLLDTSPLLSGKDQKGKPYFDSENEYEPDLARFESDSYYVRVQSLIQTFKASSMVKDGWDYKSNAYIFHLTLLAVSLFLFGLAATIATAATRMVFTVSGLGITLGAVLLAVQVYLTAVPDLRTRPGAIEHYAEGMGLVHQELRKESIAEFDQALAAAPDFSDAYLERGRAYLYMEKPDLAKALEDLKKALELDPSNASLYTELSWCQYLLGDFEGSTKTCQLGLQDRPENLQLVFQLGLNQLVSGSDKDARETYQKGLDAAASMVAEAAKNKQEAPGQILANLDEGSRMLDELAKVLEDKQGSPAPDKIKAKPEALAKACDQLSNRLASYELALDSSGKPPQGELTAKLEVTGFQDTSGKTPRDPGEDEVFHGAPAQITMDFDFKGLKKGQKVLYRTFLDGEELESWRWQESWSQEGAGSWDTTLYPEYSESFRFEPGAYLVEIFVDYHLAAYGEFRVAEK